MISIKKALEQISPTAINAYKTAYADSVGSSLEYLLDKGKKVSNYFIKNPKKIALLVGQVQSGKTATYSSVIANHFDNGGNFVVVTPSVDTILLNQTTTRLSQTFESANMRIITLEDLKDGKSYSIERLNNYLNGGKKIILVVLKNKTRLETTVKLVDGLKKKLLLNPILIDDEGDQATFDDKDSEEKRAIFKNILKLKGVAGGISMLTVTATPMAHILVNEKYPIKPDFAFYTEPGDGYLGVIDFVDEKNKFMHVVRDKIDSDFFKSSAITPESYNVAILSFFASSAFMHLFNEKVKPTSMFVHVERKKENNKFMKVVTESSIDIVVKGLIKNSKWVVDFISKFMKENKELSTRYDISEFIELVNAHVSNSKTIIVTGDREFKKEGISALYLPTRSNYIFIGSSMLQRGVTIPNLIHTYFTYRSKGVLNADTVLQRARWLGYGRDKRFMKVFLSETAAQDFIALADTVKDIEDKIKLIEERELPFPTHLERSILIPSQFLKGTRDSVVKNKRNKLTQYINDNSLDSIAFGEKYHEILSSDSVKKTRFLRSHEGVSYESFDDFIEFIGREDLRGLMRDIGIHSSELADLNDFIQKNNPKVFMSLMKAGESDTISRSYYNERTISLATGMSQKGGDYPGDRYWHRANDMFSNSLIIQLFKVKIKQNNQIIYKVAISLPEDIIGDLIHGY